MRLSLRARVGRTVAAAMLSAATILPAAALPVRAADPGVLSVGTTQNGIAASSISTIAMPSPAR